MLWWLCVLYDFGASGKIHRFAIEKIDSRGSEKISAMPDFKGYLSDLGGPSANMYRMAGKDLSVCEKCKKPSCIFPRICPNLNTDHSDLLDIYHAVDKMPEIKKSLHRKRHSLWFIAPSRQGRESKCSRRKYTVELIRNHVSGRLKVAPDAYFGQDTQHHA